MILSSEMRDIAITILPSNVMARYAMSWNHRFCTMDENAAHYQDCDGKWVPIGNAAFKFQYGYDLHTANYYLQVCYYGGQCS